jgi:hypothetical protein
MSLLTFFAHTFLNTSTEYLTIFSRENIKIGCLLKPKFNKCTVTFEVEKSKGTKFIVQFLI